jgi:hypothetical protein
MSSTGAKTKSDPSWEFLQKPLSKADLLSAGDELGRVLGSTVFNLVHRTVIQEIQDEIMQSDPHEAKLREALYLEMKVAARYLNSMAAIYQQAQALSKEALVEEEANQQLIDESYGFYELH